MIKGNKGEWSELYALFKLLGDKTLYAGDADLNKIETVFYPIIKIIRGEVSGKYEYEIVDDLVIISGDEEKLRISVKTFSEKASELLQYIKNEKGVFCIPEIEEFMTEVKCGVLKAKSSVKTDIKIVIHDSRINKAAELGFSIKSQVGGESTLLNAGKTTNFIFKVENSFLTESDIQRINAIDSKTKVKDRVSEIIKAGGTFIFESLEQNIFKNNLVLIDSLLPNILAELVKTFYTTKNSRTNILTDLVTIENPLNFDIRNSHSFYEYKIKRFLTDVALGMMPSKIWNGVYDATGGYLIVKNNGDVLCYHIYNRNQFEDYLYYNTKFETASSTRHDFATLYYLNDEIYFKLNLQIRFV